MFKQRMILNGYLGTSRVAKRVEKSSSMSNNDNDSAGFTSGDNRSRLLDCQITFAGLPQRNLLIESQCKILNVEWKKKGENVKILLQWTNERNRKWNEKKIKKKNRNIL